MSIARHFAKNDATDPGLLGPRYTGHSPAVVPLQSGMVSDKRSFDQLLPIDPPPISSFVNLFSSSVRLQLADMVNLHFVNTLQALQQVNSAVLCQLYPMWEPVLTAHHAHVPRQLRLKLDAVEAQVGAMISPIRTLSVLIRSVHYSSPSLISCPSRHPK